MKIIIAALTLAAFLWLAAFSYEHRHDNEHGYSPSQVSQLSRLTEQAQPKTVTVNAFAYLYGTDPDTDIFTGQKRKR